VENRRRSGWWCPASGLQIVVERLMSSEIKSCPNPLEPSACKTEIAATETRIEERIRPDPGVGITYDWPR
jgi:hypothetical protein